MGVEGNEKEEIPYYKVSNFQNESCKECSENPANGGAGICHCPLGLEDTNK